MSTAVQGSGRQRLCRLGVALGAATVILSIAGCGGGSNSGGTSVIGGGGGGGGNGGGGGGNSAVTTQTLSVSPSQPTAFTLKPTGTSTFTVTVPAGAVAGSTPVTITIIPESQLPAAITHAKIAGAAQPRFTVNPNNKYVIAFQLTAANLSVFRQAVSISGGLGLTTLPANTVLNVAEYLNGTYTDVATVTTTAQGGFTQQAASAVLQGITQPGIYVVYQPAQGTSTAVANFGIALIADDGNGVGSAQGSLQVVHLLDQNGNPLATPTLDVLPFPNAFDIDGEALTPDGTQGILVDGGNTVRFFSAANTGTPIASTNTLDISNYGGDGDSVAILPNGQEAVVSGDNVPELLLVSGITGGSPQPATTIATPGARDGLVTSNDGQVMLARGPGGLTVFSIAATTTTTGSLGGSVSHTFTQTMDIPSLGSGGFEEDGREGMAISPKDSRRAVVVGDSNGDTTVSLLTGLPAAPAVSSVRLQLPAAKSHLASPPTERGAKPRLALTGATRVYSVAVTPDGKNAIVGTDAGLVLVSGVDTGTLAQAGTPFSPSFTVSGQAYSLANITTLGITLDGKYVAACTPQPSFSQGTLVLIPITAGGFSAPVSQISGVAIPDNDQILMH